MFCVWVMVLICLGVIEKKVTPVTPKNHSDAADVGSGEDRLLAGVLILHALAYAIAAQADVEGAEFAEVHDPAVADELADAVHGIGQDSLDGASAEGRVVCVHVLGEAIDVHVAAALAHGVGLGRLSRILQVLANHFTEINLSHNENSVCVLCLCNCE